MAIGNCLQTSIVPQLKSILEEQMGSERIIYMEGDKIIGKKSHRIFIYFLVTRTRSETLIIKSPSTPNSYPQHASLIKFYISYTHNSWVSLKR